MNPRLRAVEEASVLVPGERESEDAVSLASCCGLPMIRKSVLEEFRARRFAAIQLEIEEKVD
jgi:hypothetical protein